MLKPFKNSDLLPILEAYGRIYENLTIPPNDDDVVEKKLRKLLDRNYDHADRIIRWYRNDRKSGKTDSELKSTYITNLANIVDLLKAYDGYLKEMRTNRMEKSKVRLDTPKGPMEFDALTGLDKIRTVDGVKRFIQGLGNTLKTDTSISTDVRKYAITDEDRKNIGIKEFTEHVMVWVTRTYESTNKFVYQLWQNVETLGRGDVYGDPDEQTPYCTHSKEHWDNYSGGDPNYEQYWYLFRDGVECVVGDLTNPTVVAAFNSLKGKGPKVLIAMDDSYGDLLDESDQEVESIDDLAYGDEIAGMLMENALKEFDEWLVRGVRYGSRDSEVDHIKLLKDYVEEYKITDGAENIPPYAFEGFKKLRKVTIPSSVKSIDRGAFYYCRSLSSIKIPLSVTSIGDDAFSDCHSLSSITIPSSVTTIGRGAFNYCTSLTSITIPSSVKTIGDYAFYYCTSLTDITIPSSVTSIGNWTFSGCRYLSSVTIPSSVTSIGDDAFSRCLSLTSIKIPSSVTSIGDDAFSGCSSLTSVTIPSSVTSIGQYTFFKCSSLTEITIPSSVTSIGDGAFEGCTSLKTINASQKIRNTIMKQIKG